MKPHWVYTSLVFCLYTMVSDSVFLWCVCVSLLCFFSYVFFFIILSAYFLKRERKRSGDGRAGSGEDLGEDEGEGVVRLYRMKKKYLQ